MGSSMFAVVMNNTFDRSNVHIQIVVAERRILLRIERFQQRRSRITAKVAPHFVDFIEHEHRIFRLRTPNALNDLPR